MKKLAVIDLGTNTFHLLIVEASKEGGFKELYRARKFIKLGENGVETIGEAPFQRGLEALREFKGILDKQEISKSRVFGTAALRTASNGPQFVHQVETEIGLNIQLISGEEEARLIHLGVAQAVQFDAHKSMIMDIGGGSVEFIIADKKEVFWAQSFPIGVSVLKNKFHIEEPISEKEIATIYAHFDELLPTLKEKLKEHPVKNLIGASGTFDVLELMLFNAKVTEFSSEIDVKNFHPLYAHFVPMTLEERLAVPSLPPDRADMIVVALVLIDYILKLAKIERITVSAFAMKEGMLAEMSAS